LDKLSAEISIVAGADETFFDRLCQTASKIDPLSAPKIDPPLPFKLNSI